MLSGVTWLLTPSQDGFGASHLAASHWLPFGGDKFQACPLPKAFKGKCLNSYNARLFDRL